MYGSSDKLGAYPETDPVTPGDLAATLFWRFGIDPKQEMADLAGRPYKLAEGQPMKGYLCNASCRFAWSCPLTGRTRLPDGGG